MLSDSFLTDDESSTFERPGRRVERSVSRVSTTPGPDRESLVARAKATVSSTQSGASPLGTLCVTVKEGDGMTWAAESVRREMLSAFPMKSGVYALRRSLDFAWPTIALLIGKRQFLQALSKVRVTNAFFAYRKVFSAPLLILYFLLAIAAEVGVLFAQAKLRAITDAGDVLVYGWALLFGLGLYIGKRVWPSLMADEGASDVKQLRGDLETSADSPEFKGFIEELTKGLASGPFPRCMIIDDWEALDVATRRTLQRYFETYDPISRGLETWFIFERDDGQRFSLIAGNAQNAERPGFRDARFANLLNITAAEKTQLCRLLEIELPPFSAIKSIASGAVAVPPSLQESFEKLGARKREDDHGEHYSAADFLAMLAADAATGGAPIDRRDLESIFTRKLAAEEGGRRWLTSRLTSEILRGTNRTKLEFRENWNAVAALPPSIVELRKLSHGEAIHVTPETGAWLAANAQRYVLPPPGLVHTFWTLFWFNRLRNAPPQAYTIRKLAQHIAGSRPDNIVNEELRQFAIEEVFEATLFAIDGCLKTCVFREVVTMIDIAATLFDSTSEMQWRRFLRRCWEAYTVLGLDSILYKMLEAGAEKQPPRPEAAADLDDLQLLFFESMGIDPPTRDRLTSDLLRELRVTRRGLEALSNYAAVRGACVAVVFQPLTFQSAQSRQSIIGTALEAARSRLPDVMQETMDRMERQPEDERSFLDVATLSLGVWAMSIGYLNDLAAYRTADQEADKVAQLDSFRRFMQLRNPEGPIAELQQLVDRAVRLVDQRFLRAGGGGTNMDADFVSHAFAQQLCALSAATSLLAASHFVALNDGEPMPQVIERATSLIEFIGQSLDYAFTEGRRAIRLNDNDVYERVDHLLRLTAVVWERLDLDQIHDTITLQRLDFNVHARGLDAEQMPRLTQYIENAELIARDEGFLALIASTTIAVWTRKSNEMVGYYLSEALSRAIEGNLGPRIRREITNILIFDGYSFDDADATLQQWLDEEAAAGSLTRYLRSIPASTLGSHVLYLFNAARSTSSLNRLIAFLRSFQKDIENVAAREEVTAITDLFELRAHIENGEPVDVLTVIARWTDRSDSWMYAAMLATLLGAGYVVPDVVDVGTKLVTDVKRQDDVNSWFNLAVALGRHYLRVGQPKELNVATNFISNKIEKWKSRSTAYMNAQAYRLLASADAVKERFYAQEADRWEMVRIRLDHMKKIPALAGAGRFFLLFKDYFDSMALYGLPLDGLWETYAERYRADAAARRKALEEWRQQKQGVPVPVTLHPPRISADFLILGHYLFTPPLLSEPELAVDRERFNEAARMSFKRLLDLIVMLDSVPPSISKLIKGFIERYDYDFQNAVPPASPKEASA